MADEAGQGPLVEQVREWLDGVVHGVGSRAAHAAVGGPIQSRATVRSAGRGRWRVVRLGPRAQRPGAGLAGLCRQSCLQNDPSANGAPVPEGEGRARCCIKAGHVDPEPGVHLNVA
jgi:hypothetical protein